MNLLRPLALATLLGGLVLAPRVAIAGPFIDDLSRCLVNKSSDQDKTVLMQWMFSAMALHPSVASMAKVSDAQREELSKKAAGLFQVLLTERCKPEAQLAVKNEGSDAFSASFKVLGEIAGTGLFSDPAVTAGAEKLGTYLDDKKLKDTFQAPAAAAAPAATPPVPATSK
jgi:hypothetical protein